MYSVVLVEPQESLNVGAVARAMTNFGFSKLLLVNPKDYSEEVAGRTEGTLRKFYKILRSLIHLRKVVKALRKLLDLRLDKVRTA